MNLRKAVIFFIVTSFVLIIVSSAVVYGNFQSRMNQWKTFTEPDREYEEVRKDIYDEKKFDFTDRELDEGFKERKEKDLEDISKMLNLSVGDIALIAGYCIIVMVIGETVWGAGYRFNK